ncbi:ATP-binding protein, partial [Streptomyces coelicoflavus]|uniref:ATP-binding protein n=1 Tax=Streptomyces coelicoflavus TaxID=285562 RepID=UPI0036BE1DE7
MNGGAGEGGRAASLPAVVPVAVHLPKTGAPLSDPRAMLGSVETRSVSPVFVGRTGELDTLNDALARATGSDASGASASGASVSGASASGGEPQALLLGGEAGVGKTRLVEEFAAAADRRGAVVALGGCVEIGADGLPFAPFSTALRALRRHLPEELGRPRPGLLAAPAQQQRHGGDVVEHRAVREEAGLLDD